MILRGLKYTGLALALGLVALITSSCTMLGLNYASLETANKPAPTPSIIAPTLADWTAQRAPLKAAFEDTLYGPWPEGLPTRVVSRRVADRDYAGGRAILEELEIAVGAGAAAPRFYLALARPKAMAPGEMGLVIGQTFSSNCGVFASTALSQSSGEPCDDTDLPWVAEYIFGEFIAFAPVEAYFDAGYAYASFYASDLVPDRSAQARGVMESMVGNGARAPTSALMAWAYGYSAAIDALAGEDWLNSEAIAVFGHSRHGKSALLAGVWDRRIDMVVSHQSGFGGAALSRSSTGEGIGRVASTYPHWFAPEFDALADDPGDISVDQHQLLALLAPTPVFLGNGRRDVWSDPNSTFRAAQAAGEVYRLYGAPGLSADGLADYRPGDGLAYWLRPGGHGTDQRDIDAIIAFLEAQSVK